VTYRSTRRDFLRTLGVGLAGVLAADNLAGGLRILAGPEGATFYVGTYTEGRSEGIYRCRLDFGSGAVRIESAVNGVTNPSFLVTDGSRGRMYAVCETAEFQGMPGGSVVSFAVNRESGEARVLNSRPTRGADPCHVTIDPSGRFVVVANYSGGSLAVYPLNKDGSLGEATDFVQHTGSSILPRQKGPHAHSVNFDPIGRFAYAADLGLDKVLIYSFDGQRGKLVPATPPWAEIKAGAGPRHLVFSRNGQTVYVVNELDSTLAVFSVDPTTGGLKLLQTIATIPQDFKEENFPADIHVSPSGKFVYCSNRGHDSIAVFAINQRTGTLSALQYAPTGGKWPRNFAIDPTGQFLLVANQKSATITVFGVDTVWGALTQRSQKLEITEPACVVFF
jgi:6-phosphogluconolactonase